MLMAMPLLRLLLSVVLALPVPVGAQATSRDDGRVPVRTTSEGFEFVDSTGRRVGEGRLRTYRIEVEPVVEVHLRWVTDLAERILSDERGWTGVARWRLQRVDRRPDVRVLIATPDTVDRLCARAGLRTMGDVSCWNGRFAAINVERWRSGADGFPGPLHAYRRYVLNHEVGHALGYGHRSCPRRGARAPVMQQQTLRTRPCRPNGWPAWGAH
jgi:hypothetical protein